MKETSTSKRVREEKNHFKKYLHGHGIDIGAGDDPLITPHGTVDVFDMSDGDAQYMKNIQDKKYDFVYSSHCLEDLENIEIGLQNWNRILKNEGFLFIIVPDWFLYEHEIWPSMFNGDHNFTFSLSKTRTDVKRKNHYCIYDIQNIFKDMELCEATLEDENFNYSEYDIKVDQTHQNALCQITMVFKKIDIEVMHKSTKIEITDNVAKIKNGCLGVGDELIMSGVCKILKQNGYYVELFLKRHEELFENNKNIDKIILESDKKEDVYNDGMLYVSCLNEYVKRFGVKKKYGQIFPEIFLTDEEIEWGKKEIEKIKDERLLACFVPHSFVSPANFLQGTWDDIVFDIKLLKEVQFVYFGQLEYSGIVNYNKFTIRQVASLIKQCDLYMGINTGLYHLSKCFELKGTILNRYRARQFWGYDNDVHAETSYTTSNDFLNLFRENYKAISKRSML